MVVNKNTKTMVAIGAAVGIGVAIYLAGKVAAEEGLATLWGIVTDAVTGSPIDSIDVTLNSWVVTTGSNGRYEFINIEPGTYGLVFTDPLGRYEPKEV